MTAGLIPLTPFGTGPLQEAEDLNFNFSYLLGLITGGAGFGFPPLASAPSNPTIGQAYFDTSLGYPLIYCQDDTWHGFQLS